MNISEILVNKYVEQVRNGKVSISDIPEPFKSMVLEKLNESEGL